MERLTVRWIISSLVLAFSGCATIPKPDVDLIIVNAPKHYVRGYNLQDYLDDGTRKPDAKPVIYPVEKIEDMNKWTCINVKDDKGNPMPEEALARMTAYIKKLREAYDRGCKPPSMTAQ